MRLPDFQYVVPKSTEEACLFLKNHQRESKILAGGTDLLPSMKQWIVRPAYLVHIQDIPELNQIEFSEQSGLRIGALVKLCTLERHPVILDRYPLISQTAAEVGSVQIREMGSVGGNLSLDTRCYYYNQSSSWRKCRPVCIKMGGETCNAIGGGKRCFAAFCGDLAPSFIALGATIKLLSTKGERILSLSNFYTGDGAKPLAIEPDEVLVEVQVPAFPPNKVVGTYLKYRIRNSFDFPLASVAAVLTLNSKKEMCQEAKVVIGAVGTKPDEVKKIGELLKERRLEGPVIEEASESAFQAAKPIANQGSTPSYRKRMIKILTAKALQRALRGGQ
jgi:4-hydroxybenzoyl-CoA reductase subunit beta